MALMVHDIDQNTTKHVLYTLKVRQTELFDLVLPRSMLTFDLWPLALKTFSAMQCPLT